MVVGVWNYSGEVESADLLEWRYIWDACLDVSLIYIFNTKYSILFFLPNHCIHTLRRALKLINNPLLSYTFLYLKIMLNEEYENNKWIFSLTFSSVAWTTDSLSVSRAEVASSKIRVFGFWTKARAITILFLSSTHLSSFFPYQGIKFLMKNRKENRNRRQHG